MPLYDYYCESCHKTTEMLQKANDPLATQCPHCHQHHLKKQVSAAAFQLKGSGWYVTDFKDTPKDTTQKTQTNTPTETSVVSATTETKKEE